MRLEKSGRNELFEWDAIVFRRGDELSLETSEEKFILIAKKKKREKIPRQLKLPSILDRSKKV